nr:hypothetical protein [Tanacetum cinerariifolium]
MADFVPGRAVIDAAQRKRGKYMAKCAAIGYGFLPFSFSSLGELETDAVTLLRRIRKIFLAQDIGTRAAIHIFNRISFAIAKGVGAQIVRCPLFSVSKPCSACSKVFTGDVYGDHAVSCAGISAGKEVDIGLSGDDKVLRPADMLLYSWDGGLDVCVDLTESSPLTRTGMADFVPGRAVIDAAQRKHGLVAISKGGPYFRLASCGPNFWVRADYEWEDLSVCFVLSVRGIRDRCGYIAEADCNAPKNVSQRKYVSGALLHNTTAQDTRERPIKVSFIK